MNTVQASGSAGGSVSVEMNMEAPPSGGKSEEGVNEAVTTISGKAAQDGPPPGSEGRASEGESARSKGTAVGDNVDVNGDVGGNEDTEEVDPRTQELREESDSYRAEAEEQRIEAEELRQEAEELREEAEERSDSGDDEGAKELMGKSQSVDRQAGQVEEAADRSKDQAELAQERADSRDETAQERKDGKRDADSSGSGSTANSDPETAEPGQSGVDADEPGKGELRTSASDRFVAETTRAVDDTRNAVNGVVDNAYNGDSPAEEDGTSAPKTPSEADHFKEETSAAVADVKNQVGNVLGSAYGVGSGEPPAEDGKAGASTNRLVDQFMRDTNAAVDDASSKLNSFWNDAFNSKVDWNAPLPSAGKSGGGGSGAQGGFVSKGGEVSVDIKPSASGYDNKIYWSDDNFKTKHEVGTDNQTGTVKLGTFPPGTRIQFGIDNGQGDFFVQGEANRNSDKQAHAKTNHQGDGSMTVGFEDLRGGGDQDFDDAVISVHEAPQRKA